MVAWRPILRSAALLTVFAVVGTGLVAMAYQVTHERILLNEREALLAKMHGMLPPERYDNDLVADTVEVTEPAQLGVWGPSLVYRARKDGQPVAAVLTPVAPDGYSGAIRLIVAVYHSGELAGVRVLAHAETPGLGDYIDEVRSNWILGFSGRALGDPPIARWRVRRDGGAFDHRTGATVTPRAVVNAVRKTLEYFDANRDELFAQAQGDGRP